MNNKALGELVGGALSEGRPLTPIEVAGVFTDEEVMAIAVGRGILSKTVATATVDGDTPEAKAKAVTETATDVLESLTPEQRQRVEVLQAAMAKKFSTEEQPLTPEAFGVVAVGEGEDRKLVVMLTEGNGLYKGSYDSVMSSKSNKDFTLEVGGQELDTRTAMTYELYQAFIADAKAKGINPLPDSEPLSKENDQPWTGTWLTGEPADGFGAAFGIVDRDEPYRLWYGRGSDWRVLRVRPAAEI